MKAKQKYLPPIEDPVLPLPGSDTDDYDEQNKGTQEDFEEHDELIIPLTQVRLSLVE